MSFRLMLKPSHPRIAAAVVLALCFCCAPLFSQQTGVNESLVPSGDQPENPGPLASSISAEMRPEAIQAAMRRVADWELKQVQSRPASRSWEFATLDQGFLAASNALHDPRYRQYVASIGASHHWELLQGQFPANDYTIAQAYLSLYFDSHDENMIAPLRERADAELPLANNYERVVWDYCDALFVEPPALANLTRLSGDPKYLKYLDHEWLVTQTLLYDNNKHLFSRDITYLDKYEKNGQKIFWSRGNGWVIAGVAQVLEALPVDSPSRPRYVQLLREMAGELASIQGKDGLWRPGLLDPENYPYPEVSGSAFFTYAIAWGINHHLLSAKAYRPVVERAWRGMLGHIYEDGRLGCIQPVGDSPAPYKEGSSYTFGVGLFLLAGSEVDILSRQMPKYR